MRGITRIIVIGRTRMKSRWLRDTMGGSLSLCAIKSSIRSKEATKMMIKSLISKYPRGSKAMMTMMETVICIDNDLLN